MLWEEQEGGSWRSSAYTEISGKAPINFSGF